MNNSKVSPLLRWNIIDHQVRLREKPNKAIGDTKLDRGQASIVATAATPAIELPAFFFQGFDVTHRGQNRNALRARRPDERIIDINVSDLGHAFLPNVQDEPRPWLARAVLLGARIVTAMVVGSGALLAIFFGEVPLCANRTEHKRLDRHKFVLPLARTLRRKCSTGGHKTKATLAPSS